MIKKFFLLNLKLFFFGILVKNNFFINYKLKLIFLFLYIISLYNLFFQYNVLILDSQ